MKEILIINGKEHAAILPCTLEQLLGELGIAGKPFVIEQNGHPVAPAQFAATWAHPGDTLEIISIVAGG